jgi:septal ring factor EnvC (AmiA/AmiB activator)
MSRMRMISIGRNETRAARPRGRGRENGGASSRFLRAHAMRRRPAPAALALVGLALLASPCAAAADKEDIAELRRMLREVQAQNRELSQRLGALESAREAPAAPRAKPARAQEPPTPAPDK